MSWPRIVERLKQGQSVTINPKGSSMTPRIRSGQTVRIEPINKPLEVDMIVLAKVKGRHYLHLISAIDGNRVQISNNHGHVNGWTNIERVYGMVDL